MGTIIPIATNKYEKKESLAIFLLSLDEVKNFLIISTEIFIAIHIQIHLINPFYRKAELIIKYNNRIDKTLKNS